MRERRELLLNTFLRPFSAAPGMAMRYRRIAGVASTRFHYVSASPLQLLPALEEFLAAEGFPAGSLHLRETSSLLRLWRSDSRRHKQATIEELLRDFPRRRFVLVGDSAGAHLVALVGTDPKWLNGAGLTMDAVRGVVALDGAAYDVPRQLEIGARLMSATYDQAFGSDPERQKQLSPTLQAARPNAPAFLVMHVQRADGVEQSEALAAALRKAGTPVEIDGFPGTGLRGHAEINRRLGEADYPATPVLDRWLARLFK